MSGLNYHVYILDQERQRILALQQQPPHDDPMLKTCALMFMDEVGKAAPDEKTSFVNMFIRATSWQAVSDIASTGKLPAMSQQALTAAYQGILAAALYFVTKKLEELGATVQ